MGLSIDPCELIISINLLQTNNQIYAALRKFMLCGGCDNEVPKKQNLRCDKCEIEMCPNCGDIDAKKCNICGFEEEINDYLEADENLEEDLEEEEDDDDYDDGYDWNPISKCTNCNAQLKDEANECHTCGLMLGGAPSGSIGVNGEEDFDHN
jgi:hypothetical protein